MQQTLSATRMRHCRGIPLFVSRNKQRVDCCPGELYPGSLRSPRLHLRGSGSMFTMTHAVQSLRHVGASTREACVARLVVRYGVVGVCDSTASGAESAGEGRLRLTLRPGLDSIALGPVRDCRRGAPAAEVSGGGALGSTTQPRWWDTRVYVRSSHCSLGGPVPNVPCFRDVAEDLRIVRRRSAGPTQPPRGLVHA
jgi:hypothetical protein